MVKWITFQAHVCIPNGDQGSISISPISSVLTFYRSIFIQLKSEVYKHLSEIHLISVFTIPDIQS